MERRLVVDGDLFASFNVAQCDEENVFVKNLHECIRLTRMVDVVRSVAATASIYTPTVIDRTDSKCLSMCSTVSFGVRNLFTGVFGNLFTSGKRLGGKASFAVNPRLFDTQTWGEL